MNAFAATVGDILTSPEEGWQRFDDNDSKIIYDGLWTNYYTVGFYNNYEHFTTNTTDSSKIRFKFRGTKLRIISQRHDHRSESININIDGITETYNSRIVGELGLVLQVINYEKLGLQDTVHTVEISRNLSGHFCLDAIDIDTTGSLLDINTPIAPPAPTLSTSEVGNSYVDLSWNSITAATSYNVKRATTAGGPYTTIADSVTSATYSDISATNGTTYYYVVTAVNSGGESINSNEISATHTAPASSGNALLIITMINGFEKEYDLSMTEVNAFIDWYNGRASGTGLAYYVINKIYNVGPFTSRKEYIVFDKILSFEVMEYN